MLKVFVNVLYRLLLELRRNRVTRLICSHSVDRWIHPRGWEPEVLQCLCDTSWQGPVWDVGAALGKHTFAVARHHAVFAFEPNLNVLYYLAYNVRKCDNVVIVPNALTIEGGIMLGSYEADFLAAPTGPRVATLSLREALDKFGTPGVIKIDIEGGEYRLIESELLKDIPLVVEWHAEIPNELPHWRIVAIDPTHSVLIPKNGPASRIVPAT